MRIRQQKPLHALIVVLATGVLIAPSVLPQSSNTFQGRYHPANDTIEVMENCESCVNTADKEQILVHEQFHRSQFDAIPHYTLFIQIAGATTVLLSLYGLLWWSSRAYIFAGLSYFFGYGILEISAHIYTAVVSADPFQMLGGLPYAGYALAFASIGLLMSEFSDENAEEGETQ